MSCTDNLTLGTGVRIGLSYRINDTYYEDFRNILCIILAVLIIAIFLVFYHSNSNNGKSEKLLRLLAVQMGTVIFILRFPYIFLGGGAYYEIPSLYVEETLNKGFRSVFMNDAGYWPFPARLMVFVVQLFIHDQVMVVFMINLCIYIFVAIIMTKFLQKDYERYLCLNGRILVVLWLISGNFLIRCEQMLTLLNAAYFTLILIILYIFQDMETASRKYYACILLSSIFLISKAAYLAVVPGLILVLIWSCLKGYVRKAIWILSALFALGLQCIYIVLNSMNEVGGLSFEIIMASIIKAAKVLYIIIADILFDNHLSYHARIGMAGAIVVILLLFLIFFVYRKIGYALMGTLFAVSSAYGNVLLDVLSRNVIRKGIIDGEGFIFRFDWYTKNVFFILICCTYMLVIFMVIVCRIGEKTVNIVGILLICAGSFYQCNYDDHTDSIEGGYSYWSFANTDNWCIPVNAKGLFARHGSQELLWIGNQRWIGLITSKPYSYRNPDKWVPCIEDTYVEGIDIDIGKRWIYRIFCEKTDICATDEIYAVLYDASGDQIDRIKGESAPFANRSLAFPIFENGITHIEFENGNCDLVSVVPSFYVEIEK